MDKMGSPSCNQERRSSPRHSINLHVDFWTHDKAYRGSGSIINASRAGLLIETFNDLPVGTRIIVEVLSPQDGKVRNFKAVAKIIRKDNYAWDDWEAYQYGLKFT